jgi:hypothetical protein
MRPSVCALLLLQRSVCIPNSEWGHKLTVLSVTTRTVLGRSRYSVISFSVAASKSHYCFLMFYTFIHLLSFNYQNSLETIKLPSSRRSWNLQLNTPAKPASPQNDMPAVTTLEVPLFASKTLRNKLEYFGKFRSTFYLHVSISAVKWFQNWPYKTRTNYNMKITCLNKMPVQKECRISEDSTTVKFFCNFPQYYYGKSSFKGLDDNGKAHWHWTVTGDACLLTCYAVLDWEIRIWSVSSCFVSSFKS